MARRWAWKRAARRLLLRVAETHAATMVFNAVERRADARSDLLRVLMYHRIGDDGGAEPQDPLVSATPDGFLRQMELVAKRYRAVSLADVLEFWRCGKSLPARAVLLTFDDGYRDFADEAWPVLARLGLSALLFVPTAFPGQRDRWFWWDRLRRAVGASGQSMETPLGSFPLRTSAQRRLALRALTDRVKAMSHQEAMPLVDSICSAIDHESLASPILDWDRLRRLRAEGLAVAPHTRTHPLLIRLAPAAARDEIEGSMRDLERELGPTPPVLAYPAGFHNDAVTRLAREAGLVAAFTTDRGADALALADRFRLHRFGVWRWKTAALLRAELAAGALLAARAAR